MLFADIINFSLSLFANSVLFLAHSSTSLKKQPASNGLAYFEKQKASSLRLTRVYVWLETSANDSLIVKCIIDREEKDLVSLLYSYT